MSGCNYSIEYIFIDLLGKVLQRLVYEVAVYLCMVTRLS